MCDIIYLGFRDKTLPKRFLRKTFPVENLNVYPIDLTDMKDEKIHQLLQSFDKPAKTEIIMMEKKNGRMIYTTENNLTTTTNKCKQKYNYLKNKINTFKNNFTSEAKLSAAEIEYLEKKHNSKLIALTNDRITLENIVTRENFLTSDTKKRLDDRYVNEKIDNLLRSGGIKNENLFDNLVKIYKEKSIQEDFKNINQNYKINLSLLPASFLLEYGGRSRFEILELIFGIIKTKKNINLRKTNVKSGREDVVRNTIREKNFDKEKFRGKLDEARKNLNNENTNFIRDLSTKLKLLNLRREMFKKKYEDLFIKTSDAEKQRNPNLWNYYDRAIVNYNNEEDLEKEKILEKYTNFQTKNENESHQTYSNRLKRNFTDFINIFAEKARYLSNSSVISNTIEEEEEVENKVRERIEELERAIDHEKKEKAKEELVKKKREQEREKREEKKKLLKIMQEQSKESEKFKYSIERTALELDKTKIALNKLLDNVKVDKIKISDQIREKKYHENEIVEMKKKRNEIIKKKKELQKQRDAINEKLNIEKETLQTLTRLKDLKEKMTNSRQRVTDLKNQIDEKLKQKKIEEDLKKTKNLLTQKYNVLESKNAEIEELRKLQLVSERLRLTKEAEIAELERKQKELERKKLEEEQRKREKEAKRKREEKQRKQEEELRIREEEKKKRRLEEEKKKRRLEEEQRKREEERRIREEERRIEEEEKEKKKRLEEELRKQEEQRIEEEKQRIRAKEEERLEKEQRRITEEEEEQKKLEKEKLKREEEEKRLREEKLNEKRLEESRRQLKEEEKRRKDEELQNNINLEKLQKLKDVAKNLNVSADYKFEENNNTNVEKPSPINDDTLNMISFLDNEKLQNLKDFNNYIEELLYNIAEYTAENIDKLYAIDKKSVDEFLNDSSLVDKYLKFNNKENFIKLLKKNDENSKNQLINSLLNKLKNNLTIPYDLSLGELKYLLEYKNLYMKTHNEIKFDPIAFTINEKIYILNSIVDEKMKKLEEFDKKIYNQELWKFNHVKKFVNFVENLNETLKNKPEYVKREIDLLTKLSYNIADGNFKFEDDYRNYNLLKYNIISSILGLYEDSFLDKGEPMVKEIYEIIKSWNYESESLNKYVKAYENAQ